MQRLANYIDGTLTAPASGAYIDNVEPATGAVYGEIPDSDGRDVDAAVDAAARAFEGWSGESPSSRGAFMLAMADAIEESAERFARAESIDNGKPIALARTVDIPRAVANLRFFATAILHTRSDVFVMEGHGQEALNYTLRQPRGVAGCISPWNLPLYLFTWKIAPALATGNTVVAKPSEVTPVTAFMLSELAADLMPPGVLNIVHGLGPKVGAPLVAHPRVPAISFTGGTATGAEIARTAGPMFKKLSLELGGKNPNVILADADLDQAIEESLRSSFANQGQICLCGSRILVQREVYDDFVEAFVKRAGALRCGDPLEETTRQGALASAAHRDKVQSYVELAKTEGGTIRCGGNRPDAMPDRCANGFFLEPTVITDLPMDCRTNREEIFGPVVTITPFTTDDEAVEAANATEYGLSASIWTRDLARAHRVAGRIQAGTVWINCWLLRDLRVPFGGMKQSGVGREGGDEALRFFTEPKNVCVKT